MRPHLQVKAVYVEDFLQCVAVVGQQVGTEGILGALVEVVVLLHQALKLRLHIGHLVRRELILIQGNLHAHIHMQGEQTALRSRSHMLDTRAHLPWSCMTAVPDLQSKTFPRQKHHFTKVERHTITSAQLYTKEKELFQSQFSPTNLAVCFRKNPSSSAPPPRAAPVPPPVSCRVSRALHLPQPS